MTRLAHLDRPVANPNTIDGSLTRSAQSKWQLPRNLYSMDAVGGLADQRRMVNRPIR